MKLSNPINQNIDLLDNKTQTAFLLICNLPKLTFDLWCKWVGSSCGPVHLLLLVTISGTKVICPIGDKLLSGADPGELGCDCKYKTKAWSERCVNLLCYILTFTNIKIQMYCSLITTSVTSNFTFCSITLKWRCAYPFLCVLLVLGNVVHYSFTFMPCC